jgi:hypothetical protein
MVLSPIKAPVPNILGLIFVTMRERFTFPFFMKPALVIFFLIHALTSAGQSDSTARGRTGNPEGRTPLHTNDSIAYHIVLGEIDLPTLRVFNKKKDQRKYDRLLAAVKKTYPLAKAAAEKMVQYAEVLETGKRKDRKALVKSFEQEIREEHMDRLKRMSFLDGRILLRLLDRETRFTSFDLVKELKGSFQAMFWQGIAGLFDYDLKTAFDPENNKEDLYIDEICRMIDAGIL